MQWSWSQFRNHIHEQPHKQTANCHIRSLLVLNLMLPTLSHYTVHQTSKIIKIIKFKYVPETHPEWSTLPLWHEDLHLALVLLLKKKKSSHKRIIFAQHQSAASLSCWKSNRNLRCYQMVTLARLTVNEILWATLFGMTVFVYNRKDIFPTCKYYP